MVCFSILFFDQRVLVVFVDDELEVAVGWWLSGVILELVAVVTAVGLVAHTSVYSYVNIIWFS